MEAQVLGSAGAVPVPTRRTFLGQTYVQVLIGNGIATIAIAKCEGAFDRAQAARAYQEDLPTA